MPGTLIQENAPAPKIIAELDAKPRFDWPEIVKCAAQPYGPPPPVRERAADMVADRMEYERRWRLIVDCRIMLIARDAGWRDSGTPAANPFPPEPMHRPDDFK
jgi:hypothetical protein